MDKQLAKVSVGWGFLLWLIGYVLGIILFAFVSPSILGWIIMPIGTLITLWVLIKKIKLPDFRSYFIMAVVWTLIAAICDYLFLVKLLKPVGYYKFDIYLYYLLTFILPVIIGWRKNNK